LNLDELFVDGFVLGYGMNLQIKGDFQQKGV